MIFTLTQSIYTGNPTLKFDSQEEAESAYKCLDDAFPYKPDTYLLGFWDFHICCVGGYENGISFSQF